MSAADVAAAAVGEPQFVLDDAYGMLAFTVVAIASCFVARAYYGSEMVAFSPRWSWHLGQKYQLFIFPTLTALAIHSKWAAGAGVNADGSTDLVELARVWLEAGWDNEAGGYGGSSQYERFFIYALNAYLLKDFFFPMEGVMVVHHVASIAMGLFSFYMPHGIGLFVATSTVFELGSCSLSWKQVKTTSWLRWEFFIVAHTLSNSGVLFFTWWYYHLPDHAWIGWTLIFMSLALLLTRQYICSMDYIRNKAKALADAQHDKGE